MPTYILVAPSLERAFHHKMRRCVQCATAKFCPHAVSKCIICACLLYRDKIMRDAASFVHMRRSICVCIKVSIPTVRRFYVDDGMTIIYTWFSYPMVIFWGHLPDVLLQSSISIAHACGSLFPSWKYVFIWLNWRCSFVCYYLPEISLAFVCSRKKENPR